MIKRLFKWFVETFLLKIVFEWQSKPIGFDKLEFALLDSNGLRYGKFPNEMDIPVLRKGQIARLEQELYSRLNDHELGEFLDAMLAALHEEDGKGNLKPNLGLIGKYLLEMRDRKKLLLHPELMFEIVAASYIREDENPAEFDLEIQEQKVKQFKADSKTGLYDFFYSSGIKELLPFLDISQERFDEFWEMSQSEIKAQASWRKSHLSPTLEPTS